MPQIIPSRKSIRSGSTQYLGRGTLDEQTAAAMKALAKSKLEKALQDSGYAQGGYAAEMEQAALMAEAKETMER